MTRHRICQGAMVCLAVVMLAWGVASGHAQQNQRNQGTYPGGQQTMPKPGSPRDTTNPIGMGVGRGIDTDPMIDKIQDQQAKSRNSDRQKRLQTDTERLLSLATELKQQVDKTDKNILSLDVIKKADEIEKLAKSVKERMKG